MQTFLPYSDFKMSAHVLDNKRLGKQRVECLQILKTLKKGPKTCCLCGHPMNFHCSDCKGKPKTTPWYNHPAVKMWKGYEQALMYYLHAMCYEWTVNRGFKDTCWEKSITVGFIPPNVGVEVVMPPWLGNEEFHKSHQSNLLRKNKDHYGKFFFGVEDNLPYVWPVIKKETVSLN